MTCDDLKSPARSFERLSKASELAGLWAVLDASNEGDCRRLGVGTAAEMLQQARDIIVFGAGDFARSVVRSWGLSGIQFHRVVDSDRSKWGSEFEGVLVESPEVLRTLDADTIVVIAAMCTDSIQLYLTELAVRHIFAERDGTVGFRPGSILGHRREDCMRIWEGLADEQSRRVFLSVLAARQFQEFTSILGGNLFTERCATSPQYFPRDLIALRNGETFIDCGVFDGDSLSSFALAAWSQGIEEWKAIGFEADPVNAARARHRLSQYGLDSIPIYEEVIGSGSASECGHGIHNCRGEMLEMMGRTAALDELLSPIEPSFVKMDIEGAELKALHGMQNTICRCRPKLAVCCYHTTLQLLEIPLYLMSSLEDYEIFLRHHRPGSLWETVCYALPRGGS